MKSSTFGLGLTLLNLQRWQWMKRDLRPNWYKPLHCPPSLWKAVPHHWGLRPYSLRTAVWVLWRSTRIRTVKELWDRAYGFLSLSEKTIITIVDVTTGSPFSSVISRPWVLIWSGFEPPTFRSADRRLSNRANRGGGYVLLLNIVWRGIQKPSAMITH